MLKVVRGKDVRMLPGLFQKRMNPYPKKTKRSFFLGGTFAKVPPKPSSKAFEAGVRTNKNLCRSASLRTDRRRFFFI